MDARLEYNDSKSLQKFVKHINLAGAAIRSQSGLPPATASWGETLSETREHVGAWWLLGARIVVSGLRYALHRDRHSRTGNAFRH